MAEQRMLVCIRSEEEIRPDLLAEELLQELGRIVQLPEPRLALRARITTHLERLLAQLCHS